MNGTAAGNPEHFDRKCQVAVMVAIVSGVTVLLGIYHRGANGPLLFDDYQQLVPLLNLDFGRSFGNLLSSSGPFGRPVSMMTFILNAVTAGPDVREWKVVNIGLHLINAMLLVWLSSWIFAVISKRSHPSCADWMGGAACALLWAAHPLHVSTVLYLVQRMTQLAALFTILSLLAYVVGRARHGNGRSGTWLVVLSVMVFAPLATLSKENGALTYPFIALLEVALFRRRHKRPATAYILTTVALTVVAAILLVRFGNMAELTERLLSGYSDRPFTLKERLFTEMRVLVMYLGQILAPYPGSMTFYYDDIEVSKSLWEPLTTTYASAMLLALAVYSILALNSAPAIALGILMFLVGHSLESTALPLELAFEHRNYFPSYGLFVAIVALLWSARVGMVTRLSLGACALVALATLTCIRVDLWKSDATIAAHAIRYRPGSDTAASVLAQRLTQEGRFDDARAVLRSANSSGRALQELYIACIDDGRIEPTALRSVTQNLEAHVNSYMLTGLLEVSNLALDGRCEMPTGAMIELLKRASKRGMWGGSANRTKLDIYRAQLMWENGDRTEAVTCLLNAYAKDNKAVIALLLAAKLSADMGESEASRDILDKAIAAAGSERAYYQDLIDEIVARLETGAYLIR